MKRYSALLILLVLFSTCEPLVEKFDEETPCQYYQAEQLTAPPAVGDNLLVMTWNIRYGAGNVVGWFGDGCGDRVILAADEVLPNLEKIAEWINTIRPDIVLLQEIDVEAKRTAYIDQVQYLLDHTYLNYGVYASNWKAQYIPSDGLGRMDEGNAILAPWPLDDAIRFQLPLRNDQDGLTNYFYLRDNMIQARLNIPGVDSLYVACTHLTAYATDDTKQLQVEECTQRLLNLQRAGYRVVAGGDLNLIPSNATYTDFCIEETCEGEHFHGPNDNPYHREGANYTPELAWINPFFEQFQSSMTLDQYIADEQAYFSYSILNGPWDRALDYLFSNSAWAPGSHKARQDVRSSDHCPVTAQWVIPK
jgi:endonuclease/exonuclease/phosphatase family metal-dependent hydrolase